MKKKPFVGAIFVILLLLFSCTSTKLTSVWKDNTYDGGYIENVMVVAVSNVLRNRKIFESEFVEQFKKLNINAVSSVAAIPSDRELNKDVILTEARKQKLDMIMVTHLIGVEEEQVYHPPKTYTAPRRHYNRFGTYYPRVYEYVHEPGYYTQHKNVNLESNLYDARQGKLIWSVTSETLDPKSVNDVIKSLSKVVIKSLRKNELLR